MAALMPAYQQWKQQTRRTRHPQNPARAQSSSSSGGDSSFRRLEALTHSSSKWPAAHEDTISVACGVAERQPRAGVSFLCRPKRTYFFNVATAH